MFMVKDEFANVQNLLKVRFKTRGNSFLWLFIILGGFMLSSLIGTISTIVENRNSIHYYIVSDNSTIFLIGLVIGYIVMNIMYRSTNVKLSVFPQTNNSRFISWLLLNYSLIIVFSLMLLITYLVHYGVILLMSAFNDSIHLALNVDFGFIVAGLFAYLMYGFLIIATIELISAVIRKWSYYAIVTFIALFMLMVINLERVIEYIPRVLSFLIAEPSLILFFLKAIGLWLIITAVTLVLNHYTVYHKSQNWILKKRITIACVIIAIVIIVITPMILRFSITISDNSQNSGLVYSDVEWDDIDIFLPKTEEIKFDISHLPDGIKININGEDIKIGVLNPDFMMIFSSNELVVYIGGAESLGNVQGDMIVVRYSPPWYIVNGIDIFRSKFPEVTIYFEGDTLFINYSFDNTTVIIMPIWSMVRQFDIFKDKGVLTAHALGSSAGGSTNVTVFIDVE